MTGLPPLPLPLSLTMPSFVFDFALPGLSLCNAFTHACALAAPSLTASSLMKITFKFNFTASFAYI
ncbi:unnamed protein product [Acanthoscelides obtectus]|uniref:Uncharacterized protein n=1 Tax=Acanthoscelides obtectus TaxID=200917 RepID=A0A9P0MCR3_ACAOB|nr:unnamed protein product [Acanthoscelides obtectus]CAK1652186.1 hypothetical protein AOBTE_LOCUS17724 [Acanthoscelides obtectus]